MTFSHHALYVKLIAFALLANYFATQQVNHASDAFNTFVPVLNYVTTTSDETGILLTTTAQTSSAFDCMMQCNSNTNCQMITYNVTSLICKTFNMTRYSGTFSATTSNASNSTNTTSTAAATTPVIFYKYVDNYSLQTASLVYHWPFNGNMNDIVSGANGFGAVNYAYTYDRLQAPYSALYLNSGYVRLPALGYITGDFTLAAWVYVYTSVEGARLIEFNSPLATDWLTFHLSYSGNLAFSLCSPTSPQSYSSTPVINSGVAIPLNSWHHVAYTVASAAANVYLDGVLKKTTTAYQPRYFTRSTSFIGASNYTSATPNAVIDDLKIFNQAFGLTDILRVLNSYY